jgi:diguanylate cyclase (GGDEF)-like protein
VINDSLGHIVGDGVLMAMADRLLGFIRPADTLARLGGDEFVIVAEDLTDEREAVALGERVAEAGRRPFQIGGETLVCTVSVGIATTTDAHHAPQKLLQEADLALYRAKDRGRNRAEVFDEDLRTTAVGRLGTERMLRRAIDESRLHVLYQPIIELSSSRVVSVEALIRVIDPNLGMLEPDSFLTVAEETGLLATMDEWVFAEAIQQAAGWCERLGGADCPRINLNVTSRRVTDASFHEAVIGALDSNGLSRNSLQVEVTERVLMEASNSALAGLRALRDGGVQVGLDDFGTGFSSLAYLRQFPLDFVKIDRSFIQGLARGSGEIAIVNAIIGLSHAFGLEVVAEGVETSGQLDVLAELGCDQAQGFLLARPGEPQAVDELVMAGGHPQT